MIVKNNDFTDQLCRAALEAVLMRAQALTPQIWVATLGEISDGWRAKAGATVGVHEVNEDTIEITVTNVPAGAVLLVRSVEVAEPTYLILLKPYPEPMTVEAGIERMERMGVFKASYSPTLKDSVGKLPKPGPMAEAKQFTIHHRWGSPDLPGSNVFCG